MDRGAAAGIRVVPPSALTCASWPISRFSRLAVASNVAIRAKWRCSEPTKFPTGTSPAACAQRKQAGATISSGPAKAFGRRTCQSNPETCKYILFCDNSDCFCLFVFVFVCFKEIEAARSFERDASSPNNPQQHESLHPAQIIRPSAIVSATTFAAASATNAAIIYSGPVNLTANSSSPVFFDLDGDTGDDYKFFFHDNNKNKPIIASADYDTGVGTNLTFAANSERGLSITPAGTTIDANFLGGVSQAYSETFFYENVDGPTVVGSWFAGDDPVSGYVGFAIPRNGGTDFNFGWAQMVVDVNTQTVTLVDYAYETELNTGIVTAVPEVSTTSAFVVGALALLLLRRRQQRAH